jgi:hypothetical protein
MTPITVHIIGMPAACLEGVSDPWREHAAWIGAQLRARFGDAARVAYHSVLDADCPPTPPDAAHPLVMIEGEIVLSGGNSIPLPPILQRVTALLPGA